MSNPSSTDQTVYRDIEREGGFFDFEATQGVAHVVVHVGPESGRTERVLKVFRVVADAGVPVFLAKLHGSEVSFAMNKEHLTAAEEALAANEFTYRSRQDLAVVTIRTDTLQDLTGIMVRIADALQLAGARMYGVGDSHSSVQCLIDGHRVPAALEQLRAAFAREVGHA